MKTANISYGSDPELFIRSGTTVVGSERIIPKDGLLDKQIVRDGFQVEFNPRPSETPDGLVDNIASCFKKLISHVGNSKIDNANITLERVVDITQEEMDSMSKASKIFGCMPSYNIYGDSVDLPSDASAIMFRSAGGHIHLGSYDEDTRSVVVDYSRLIPVLDILMGVTMVTIDPDPASNARRRKYYGRAGEFRMPAYGVEYRTPSNIWLKHPVLAKFILNTFVKASVNIVLNDREQDLLNLFSSLSVRDTINKSDVQAALNMYETYKEYLRDYVTADEFNTIKNFQTFANQFTSLTDEQSLEAWNNY